MKEWLEHRWGYLRFIDNWHKNPLVSKLMCKLGRHDYETKTLCTESAILYCFYCGHQKQSFVVNTGFAQYYCDCCPRANEYNGFHTGPHLFECPKHCPCHD